MNDISDSEKRKEHIRNIFSKQWSRTREQYGTSKYDKDLIHELTKNLKNGTILDIGCGDGVPYSKTLDELGYEVYGIDISPTHVLMVKKSLPNINVDVGDAEDLQFSNNFFDIVFCFHSTWQFPNLIKSISEMLKVVKDDGMIMFDIQNRNHPIHKKFIKEQLRISDNYIYNITTKFLKNFIKLLIRPIKYYPCDWSFKKHIITSTPTAPSTINVNLQEKKNVEYKLYGVNLNNSYTLEEIQDTMNLDQFDRLVYKIIKKGI